ncbi:MAG: glycosyltransferase family 4 protein [Bacillota bacterium]|nr:glycosyltransferase family 4 protein [Bacillota bacterium]
MNIGVFTDSFRPYSSGVVRSIELFSREYIKRGHSVFVFCPNYPRMQQIYEEGVYRFASVPWPTMADFSLPIPMSASINQKIEDLGLDIIHAHSPFLLGRLGARAARQHKLPLVFTFHTLYEQYVHYFPFVKNTSKMVIKAIARNFSNSCNVVIAPTKLVENYLRSIGIETAIVKIPTGIDMAEFKDLDRNWLSNNYGVGSDEKVLLFVGRLGKEKNVVFLIKSFQEVLKSIPACRLVLVGKGPQEGFLRQLCRQMGIENKVIYTGELSRQQIVHCYASADIFVFPSVTDTQGLVIGEAKAAGIPVVAIRAFGPAEMVNHNEDGILTELSLTAFTEAIVKLIRDKDLYAHMRKQSLINAPIISSELCSERMLEVYQDLIDLRISAPLRKKPYSKRKPEIDYGIQHTG